MVLAAYHAATRGHTKMAIDVRLNDSDLKLISTALKSYLESSISQLIELKKLSEILDLKVYIDSTLRKNFKETV
jgi:hypothetical protein